MTAVFAHMLICKVLKYVYLNKLIYGYRYMVTKLNKAIHLIKKGNAHSKQGTYHR